MHFFSWRSYNLVFLKDNRVEGIDTLDFHLPHNTFYNSSLNPLNEGFTKSDNYLGNGVQNISVCYGSIILIWFLYIYIWFKILKKKSIQIKDLSGFISQPHFLHAEQKFIDAIDGMRPNQRKHETILHFEPVDYFKF